MTATAPARRSSRTRRAVTIAIWVYLAAVVLYRDSFDHLMSDPAVQNWSTIFLSLTLQALPFLVLGVVVSAAVSTFVSPALAARVVPKDARLAIPAAGLAGAFLPGCECSSVPVAGRLVSRGVSPSAALTFLLAAPAINPVVMVATAVAFPGRPEMVAARFVASFLAAVTVGSLWGRVVDTARLQVRLHEHVGRNRADTFTGTVGHDLVQAGGYLVLGTMLVATLQTAVPASVLDSLGGSGVVAVLSLALLAVVLSICSEADAFVAAGLSQFSLTSRLAFLVVGPMVDLKLISLHAGTFGRPFAARFAPLTFVVAVAWASLVGWVLL